MAETIVANNSSLNPIYVQEKVIAQYAERQNFFAPYMGESPTSAIQVVSDLAKRPGDTVKVHVFSKLNSQGVDNDATLEGNEESLSYYADTLYLGQKRNAVRIAGRMTEQRSAIDLRKQAGFALGVWAKDFVSELMTVMLAGRRGTRTLTVLPTSFTAFGGNSLRAPDATHELWAGSAATQAAMTASDKMTASLLDKAIVKVQLLINSGIPMRPIDPQGRYLCVITPEQAYDLFQDADFVAAQQFAADRGKDNPLFTGALGTWKNLILVTNPAGVLFTSSASVPVAQAQILGSQAGAWVKGKETGASAGGGGSWRYTEKEFDFDNQVGFAVASLLGVQKLQFNGKDHGAFSVYTSYTAI